MQSSKSSAAPRLNWRKASSRLVGEARSTGDGGTETDGGAITDGGTETDGGTPDGGSADGGTTDGDEDGSGKEGGSCSSLPGGPAVGLVLGLVGVLRRRRV